MQQKPVVRYYSTQINSHFKKGPKGSIGETRENTVRIEGANATKSVTTYNATGRVVKRATRRLKPAERRKILTGVFVPRLFADCNSKTRKKCRTETK